jgi:hypothetical protein
MSTNVANVAKKLEMVGHVAQMRGRFQNSAMPQRFP